MRTVILVWVMVFFSGACFAGLFKSARDEAMTLKWSHIEYEMKTEATAAQLRTIESLLKAGTGASVRRVSRYGNVQIALKWCPTQGVTHFRGRKPPLVVVDPNAPDGFAHVMEHEIHHLVRPFFHPE